MTTELILTLNAGSSSIKFALYEAHEPMRVGLRGQIESIGGAASLQLNAIGAPKQVRPVDVTDHAAALSEILKVVGSASGGARVIAVGHRITHGGPDFSGPQVLDSASLDRLRRFIPWAPLHQPYNLEAVDGAARVFPGAIQVGCFDTGYHRGHPWVSDAYALPRRYYDAGLRRYGFHGLSYQSVVAQLTDIDPNLANGRIVIAHLGNGASMCAVKGGRSITSTMGFTALDGLAMGTRCGVIDPGVLLYLLQEEGLTADALSRMLYRESGLLGLSGLSSDMRELEASQSGPAREAIDYFVHRIRVELGALTATLGGLDCLAFCGGIGENSAEVRSQVCRDLDWLGIALDDAANRESQMRIGLGRTPVFVIRTDEEGVIAHAAMSLLTR
ncbi:MAG: acetate/propionate family kinase [Hyphomicrobiaceae bacterium]|nr:acetate/propionate family kinase [Hyphomicrobiaceae bacterium]